MAQRVEVPGVGVLEFPDGMSQQDMASAIHKNFPKLKPRSVGEDVAKTVPAAAARGLINLAGAPADIWEFLSGGAASLAGKFTSPEFAQALKEVAKPELPLPTSERIRGGVEKVTGELHKPKTRAGKFLGGVVEAAAPGGLFGKAQAGLGAVSGVGSEVAGMLTDDDPTAKALAGLIAPLGAQGVLAHRAMPGQMLREATGDISPQEFEQARQLTERAKALGINIMGPEALPPSSIQQLASDVIASKEGGRVMNRFLSGRPEQVKEAVNRGLLTPIGAANTPDVNMALARKAADEVISGAEGFRTAATRPYYLAQKQDDLAGMLLESKLPGLEDAASAAQRSYADLLGQGGQLKAMQAENLVRANNWIPVPGMPRVPGQISAFPEVASEAHRAATEVAAIRVPESRNAMMSARMAADNTRKALEAKGYSKVSDGVESILGNIDSEIALAGPGTDKAKILTDLRNKLAPGGKPLDKPYRVEGVYQETSRRLNPPINAPVEDRIAAGVLGEHAKALDDLVQQNSATLKQGRGLYREMTERVVEPLTSGPVGRVAGRQGFDPALPENLNPISAVANEKIARPDSIRELYTHLNKQDKQAFPGIARTWLENAFDQASQKVQAGENRMVGANFVKSVYGTPQQEANFMEAMKGVAKAHGRDAEGFAKGAKNLLEVLQSTGRVAGAGSPTGGRLPTNEMARSSRIAATMESASASPLRPMAQKIRDWAMSANYRKLAEIMTAPDSIDQIIRIGKYQPTTTTSMALTMGLLEANAEAGFAR